MKRTAEQILTEWLVLQVQAGKQEALTPLLQEWYPRLLHYAAHQLGDREAAREAVQETMLNLTRGITGLRDPATFPRWCYQILQRRCHDQLRKVIQQRGREQELDLSVETPATPPPPDPAESLALHKALASLSREARQVVHLHYLVGFNIGEIASITGVPEGTIKSRLHYARQQLRAHLGGSTDESP